MTECGLVGMYAFEAAFLRDEEEVIMFEPFFDQVCPLSSPPFPSPFQNPGPNPDASQQYLCNTTFQSGKPVFVAMTPPENASSRVASSSEWKVDIEKLRAAITPKTKMMCVPFLRYRDFCFPLTWGSRSIVNTPHNP